MFEAICADCGNACKVPFNPTGEKPVYCSDCFDKHRDSDPARSNGGSFGGERRSFDRPRENSGSSNGVDPQLKELIAMQNSKLDEVIALLTLMSGKKTVRVTKKVEEPKSDEPAIKVVD
jgi:CxxC-x17-CxxC domain-containing protein